MDPSFEGHYWMQFENRFQRLTRDEFQGWFVDIMGWAFPGDFIATRQGTSKGGGDRSCDGFRKSTGTVYAVYAPRSPSPSELKKKILDDFNGALSEFCDRMKEWVFVHNERDERASTDTILVLTDLKNSHPHIRIESHIGKRELWDIVRRLEPRVLHTWFPEPPNSTHMERVGLAELQPVIRFLERQPVPIEVPTDAPDQEKLEYNRLSSTTESFLRLGRQREKLVAQYFDGCSDIEMGESIAQSFRDRYQRMREDRWEADSIFHDLYGFAGGFHFHSPIEQAAVYAVLSHFFERCDIFENPPKDAS